MRVAYVPSLRPSARWVLTPTEMQAADARAIADLSVPGLALMENAGRHVARAALTVLEGSDPVVIVCGGGNNGGDGFVAARHLASWGQRVVVYATALRHTYRGDAESNLRACELAGITVFFDSVPPTSFTPCSLVIDALLGTGLKGAVREGSGAWIQWMNHLPAPRLSVDVPSGLCALKGAPLGPVVSAQLTVTFACSKWGHWLGDGPDYVGALEVVDIGMPDLALAADAADHWLLSDVDLAPAFRPRPRRWHKGNAGRVWLLGGSQGRSGALRMAADGALRAGAGLVTLGTTAGVAASLQASAYEAMVEVALEPADDVEHASIRWRQRVGESDAIVAGPGYPVDPCFRAPIVDGWSSWACPAVFDADGLNHLARAGGLSVATAPRVMTPHPGEAARLLGISVAEVEADRLAALQRLVIAGGAVVVLKGAQTLVGAPGGAVAICPDGNPGMASAGMGDILSGVIGALLARGLSPMDAACAGVLWHARAGDRARTLKGENGLLARDVIDSLGDVERRQC